MRLRVKIACPNCSDADKSEIISQLENSNNLNIRPVRNGIMFDPEMVSRTENESIYQINKIPSPHILLIDVSEHGGYNTATNLKASNIVCGKSGRPIRPYHIPNRKDKDIACGDHALFSIPETCVTIEGSVNDNGEETVRIIENTIVPNTKESNIAKITHKLIYAGSIENGVFNKELERFHEPALVAIDKANCENCTHVHYYMDSSVYATIRR